MTAQLYEGQWYDLLIVGGNGVVSGNHPELVPTTTAHGGYLVPQSDGSVDYITTTWNKGYRWGPSWAKIADDIHTAFRNGDKGGVNTLVANARATSRSFADAKGDALDAYADWAAN